MVPLFGPDGHFDQVKTVNSVDAAMSLPPLLKAVIKGDVAESERLLLAGADPDEAAWDGDCPVMQCCYQDRPEILKLLAGRGTKLHGLPKWDWQPVHDAARLRSSRCLEILVEHGVDFRAKSESGLEPIHFAVTWGSEDSLRFLCQRGVDPDVPMRPRHQRPLHLAVIYSVRRLFPVLEAAGADPNLGDQQGQTPLHLACLCGDLDCIRLLLKMGADPRVLCHAGKAAFDVALDEAARDLLS